MLIDAHVHIWQLTRGDYAWLTPDLPFYRDVTLADYAAATTARAIDAIILVQAAPTVAETAWLLDRAAADPRVAGVVGWIDVADPTAAATLPGLAACGLVGIRPMLQDIAPVDWVMAPEFAPVFDALAATDLVFDALIWPVHLPVIAELAARHPDLAIVIDHLGKPGIAGRSWQPWADDLAALARFANVAVKLSGLWTEARSKDGPSALAPYIAHALATFGGERLIWGSDWPVLTPHVTTDGWYDLCNDLLPEATHYGVFGENARRIYRLEHVR